MIKLTLSAETREGPQARNQLTDPAVRPLPPRCNAPAAPVGRLDADSRTRSRRVPDRESPASLACAWMRQPAQRPVHGCGNLHRGVCRLPLPYHFSLTDMDDYGRNVLIEMTVPRR